MSLFGPSYPVVGPNPFGPAPYTPPGNYTPVGSYQGAGVTGPVPGPYAPAGSYGTGGAAPAYGNYNRDTYQPSRYSPFYNNEALPPTTPQNAPSPPGPTMSFPNSAQNFAPSPSAVPSGPMMRPGQPMAAPAGPMAPASPGAMPASPGGIPARRIPPGPVYGDLGGKLNEEMGVIKDVPAALKVIGFHFQQAEQLRDNTRHLLWGARFYATQAAKLGDAVIAQRATLGPAQIQAQVANLQATRQKAVDYLNKAKEYAVTNYNQAVAATSIYNTLFTGTGPFTAALTGPDRMKVDLKLNEMWTRWIGGFTKNGNGIVQQADPLPLMVDKATQDVTGSLSKVNAALQQLGG